MSSRDVVWEHGENHHPGWQCNYCHMHNYYYDIICMQNYDIIPLLRFCEVLYINLCIGHAKIFINLPLGDHEKYFRFVCLSRRFTAQTDRLPVLTETVYRSEPIALAFWFVFFEFVRFLPVTAAYQPVYQNRWLAVQWTDSVMKTLAMPRPAVTRNSRGRNSEGDRETTPR
jgi:hypothetical protein